jgi:hypothetical protein
MDALMEENQINEDLARNKQAAKSELSKILESIIQSKLHGQSPSNSLLADAFSLAMLYPFPDILAQLEKINNAALEATQSSSQNANVATDSWLSSKERKEFDELVEKDPMLAADQYFKDERVVNSTNFLSYPLNNRNNMLENTQYILSQEDRYKTSVLANKISRQRSLSELEGKDTELADSHLAEFAKRNIYKNIVLERQRLNAGASLESVIKKDGDLIVEKFSKTVETIQQNIEGGLSSVGATMSKSPQIIDQLIKGDVNLAQETIIATQAANKSEAQTILQNKPKELIREERIEVKMLSKGTIVDLKKLENKGSKSNTLKTKKSKANVSIEKNIESIKNSAKVEFTTEEKINNPKTPNNSSKNSQSHII